MWPNISALALLYVIGAYAIAFGIFGIGGAFSLPLDGTDKALIVLMGLVSILFGVVIFASPGEGALVLLALIAAFSLVVGISELVVAIGGKRLLERDLKSALAQASITWARAAGLRVAAIRREPTRCRPGAATRH